QDGTAKGGSDFTAASGTVTIPAGQTSATFAVAVLGDGVIEPDETFNVTLSNPSHGFISRGLGTGTILNDDAAGTFMLTSATYSADQSAGSITATVIRFGGNAGGVTVDFATANGTALAGVDYLPQAGTLTFATGQTTASITIPLVPTGQVKPPLTFTLAL